MNFESLEVAKKIVPEEADKIAFHRAEKPCFGQVLLNERFVIEATNEKLKYRFKCTLGLIIPLLVLLSIPLVCCLSFGILNLSVFIASCLFVGGVISGYYTLRKDLTATREMEKIAAEPPAPEFKYIVIYDNLRSFIHELLHIKKSHLKKEVRRLERIKEDYIVDREAKKIFKKWKFELKEK